jgi:hypothetical protein
MFRRPVPAFALGLVAALVILTVALPEGRAALSRIVKIFQVGDSTFIHTPDDFNEAAIDSILTAADQQIEKGEIYLLLNDYGGIGGPIPEGADPFVKQLGSLSLTAREVDFPLQVPTHFHEDIPARFRFMKSQILPSGSVIMYFGLGPWETMLMQTPVGEGQSIGFGGSVMKIDDDGQRSSTGIAPQVEEIEIGDLKVAWVIHDEGARRNLGKWAEKKTDLTIGKFLWEADGVSYVLDGRLLTLEEGRKIIASLQPLTKQD